MKHPDQTCRAARYFAAAWMLLTSSCAPSTPAPGGAHAGASYARLCRVKEDCIKANWGHRCYRNLSVPDHPDVMGTCGGPPLGCSPQNCKGSLSTNWMCLTHMDKYCDGCQATESVCAIGCPAVADPADCVPVGATETTDAKSATPTGADP